MAVKVFCTLPTIQGYQVDPPNSFLVDIVFTIYTSDPIAVQNGSTSVTVPIGTSPYAVYGEVYQKIVDITTQYQLETPTKNDIFGYIPTPFSILLPDLPAFA
jgi:hypothetical protein